MFEQSCQRRIGRALSAVLSGGKDQVTRPRKLFSGVREEEEKMNGWDDAEKMNGWDDAAGNAILFVAAVYAASVLALAAALAIILGSPLAIAEWATRKIYGS
jgi:hypothetical protein